MTECDESSNLELVFPRTTWNGKHEEHITGVSALRLSQRCQVVVLCRHNGIDQHLPLSNAAGTHEDAFHVCRMFGAVFFSFQTNSNFSTNCYAESIGFVPPPFGQYQ
ncbi:unnamed protein product [Dicrocoelium dendriticum]|nr:unnamed protein product [Dicrocoelium dendriticum]